MSRPRAMVGKRRVGLLAITGLGVVAAFGHVIYPAWLALRTRGRPDVKPPEVHEWPDIAVVIPAFRESRVIDDKVANIYGNGYPGVLEVIVVADDESTASAARKTDASVISQPVRLGKAQALNAGIEAARADIAVFTDANNALEPGALEALVRWFADPTIGAVAGEKRVEGSSGEGVYWRFESWLKRRETRTGTTIGVVGELGAVRRSVYRELPVDVVIDDLWIALDVIESGYRIVYEPRAVTRERESATLRVEWERRTRIISGVLGLFVARWHLLVPGSSPVTAQLWGHRLVRSALGPPAHLSLVILALTNLGSSRVARIFVAAHTVAALALFGSWRGAPVPRLLDILAKALFLQLVALGGVARFVRGDAIAKWPKMDRELHGADMSSENGTGS